MKSLKTPLRYPGGKSRACEKMYCYFPDLNNYSEFREPFLGGGSVSLYITKKYPDLNIWVNDMYEPLFNFWNTLQSNAANLKIILLNEKINNSSKEKAKELFFNSKDKINDHSLNNIERAAAFYIVNKCSFSGLTESGSFSEQSSIKNFTISGIQKLTGYSELISKWKITNLSYENLLDNDKNAFVYLDPPYDIKNTTLYGKNGKMHKGFDHQKFANTCDAVDMNMIISYNADQLVKDRFVNWNAAEYDLTYTMQSVGDYMKNQQNRKELLLFNY